MAPTAHRTAPDERTAPAGAACGSGAPVVLRVPVDPLAERGPAELVAAWMADALDAPVRLEVSPTGPAADLAVALAERCQDLRLLGVRHVGWSLLRPGRAADAILEVDEAEGEVLCMSLGSSHAPGTLLFSSVTEEVLRRSTVPVLLAGPHLVLPTAPPDHVVVAVDGSPMAHRALELGRGLAALLGATVRSVRVEAPRGGDPLVDPLPDRREGEVEVEVEVVESASPVAAILAAASAAPGRTVLVIGAHKRPGRRRFALGSTALELVRRATCPVLVVPARCADRSERSVSTADAAGATDPSVDPDRARAGAPRPVPPA